MFEGTEPVVSCGVQPAILIFSNKTTFVFVLLLSCQLFSQEGTTTVGELRQQKKINCIACLFGF